MNEDAQPRIPDANRLAQDRTDMATERTVMAAERTLMAWMRTSVSLISFGFTVYKFLEYLRQAQATHAVHVQAPRNFGLALITLGTVALCAAIWQHRSFLKRLGQTQARNMWSLAVIISLLTVLIGVLAFLGVLLRAGPF